jgi:ribose 5-phosphate isomerase B
MAGGDFDLVLLYTIPMIIYIGADHRGFNLKEHLKTVLKNDGYDVIDVGAATYDKDDDFPVFAGLVAGKVGVAPETDRGILICGSGFGMDIAADKYKNIRAALPMSVGHAYQARHDDDANVLAIATDFTDEKTAEQIVKTFLATPFAKEERSARRIEEIRNSELEK